MQTILQILAGSWFVVSSNFPMWLNGRKTDPQFHYTIMERKGVTVLDDKVTFVKNGKQKSIKGYDKQLSERKFTWRGYGLLGIAKSNWEVRLLDADNEWAVIYFSKTLFTPEGVDIIAKQKTLSAGKLSEIKERMLKDEVLKKHVHTLKDL